MYMIRLTCLAFVLTMATGCGPKIATVYPTKGPLVEQGQVQPFKMTMTGFDSGECTLTLPSCETCQGNYTMVLDQAQFWGNTSGYNWKPGWGSTWGGSSMSFQSRTGVQFGMASLACSQGTTMEIRFIVSGYDGHGIGMARDNQGNLFKVYL